MKDYIEERAVEVAEFIIENNATVRQAAKRFGISKSTVHMVMTKQNGGEARLYGQLNRDYVALLEKSEGAFYVQKNVHGIW